MSRPSNFVSLTGRLVADPEIIKDTIVSMRLAVDWAGSNQANPDNKTGFFPVKYFLSNPTNNGKFVKSQLEQGNMKKGSAISIIGEMRQESWKTENDENRSVNVIIADVIDYAMSSTPKEETTATTGTETIAVPDEF